MPVQRPPATAVVTDSTSYIPTELIGDLPISVVPLHVVLGEHAGEEGSDIQPADVASELRRRGSRVSTSRPSPERFIRQYHELLDAGVHEIVSVHISSELSGTWDAARMAAEECNLAAGRKAVAVVDSRIVCMAMGYAVLAAARAAVAGGDAAHVEAVAQRMCDQSRNFFYVDTLEFLRRGGRIGAAQALVGSALAVKPLLHLQDGRIVPLEKVRTSARAISRLRELAIAESVSRDGKVVVAVQHLAAADRAEKLRQELQAQLPEAVRIDVAEVGAVVGAHVGPGLLAIAISPDLDERLGGSESITAERAPAQ